MKPHPKPTAVICSSCGLAWDKHTDRTKKLKREPNHEDCIELLKAEAKKRPAFSFPQIASATGSGATYTWQ